MLGKQWYDVLEIEVAEALAHFDGEFFRGKAAFNRNAYGCGQVYYIGTVGHQALYNKVARMAVQEAALPYIPALPARVEITTRTNEHGAAIFIFNNDSREKPSRLRRKASPLPPLK